MSMTDLNMTFCDIVQPQILGIHPYIPGKPVSELQRELGLRHISKLASNENPLGTSPKVLQAIQNSFNEISRYPDGSAYNLKAKLSEFLGVSVEQLAIGNGSNELLELVARVFAGPGDEIIYSQYGFAVYPISAQIVGAKGVEVPADNWGHDLPAMLSAITHKTKLIYLANPNNPTGTLFNRIEFEQFISKVPEQVVVVLDEAYIEYAQTQASAADYPNGIDYLASYSNLLVSRTFSKAYGLASLRVGYLAGCDEIIQYINQIRAPFNVNHFAQVSALAALDDVDFVARVVALNQQGMQQIIKVFNELGLEYIPSAGNFVCVHLGEHAAMVNQKLLEQGVIVRPVTNYGLPQFLRVSVGTPLENKHFIDALKSILKGTF